MQIKIATESPTQLRILENSLRILGYRDVRTYQTGRELLEHAESGNTKLVIVSKQLADMEGLTVTKRLHHQQETGGKFIPVLLIGSEFTHQQIVEAIQRGVSQILVTPITTSELGRKLEAVRSALHPAA